MTYSENSYLIVKVQEALSDWDKFDEVAEKAAAKGYKMLSGYDDSYRTFSNNVSGPWVDGNKIVIDDSLWRWINQTKEYTDKGYNNKTSLWSPEWSADVGRILRTFKIKKNVEVTDNGKIII